MKIGLKDVDGHNFPNLALMKLSARHKALGDQVEFYEKPKDFDVIFASKIFNTTPDFEEWPTHTNIIKGGSGYDYVNQLTHETEHFCPDYDLYKIDYALGFTSRGCLRKCPFCIVPEKEGKLRAVADIYEFWRGQKEMVLLDNNLLGLPDHAELIFKQIHKEKIKIDFNQGLDIRLLTQDMADLLALLKYSKSLRFAFDWPNMEKQVNEGLQMLSRAGINSRRMRFYVLVGFSTTREEDMYRVMFLRDRKVDVFVMPYDKKDPYQMMFSTWVNQPRIFKTKTWEEYCQQKNNGKYAWLLEEGE